MEPNKEYPIYFKTNNDFDIHPNHILVCNKFKPEEYKHSGFLKESEFGGGSLVYEFDIKRIENFYEFISLIMYLNKKDELENIHQIINGLSEIEVTKLLSRHRRIELPNDRNEQLIKDYSNWKYTFSGYCDKEFVKTNGPIKDLYYINPSVRPFKSFPSSPRDTLHHKLKIDISGEETVEILESLIYCNIITRNSVGRPTPYLLLRLDLLNFDGPQAIKNKNNVLKLLFFTILKNGGGKSKFKSLKSLKVLVNKYLKGGDEQHFFAVNHRIDELIKESKELPIVEEPPKLGEVLTENLGSVMATVKYQPLTDGVYIRKWEGLSAENPSSDFNEQRLLKINDSVENVFAKIDFIKGCSRNWHFYGSNAVILETGNLDTAKIEDRLQLILILTHLGDLSKDVVMKLLYGSDLINDTYKNEFISVGRRFTTGSVMDYFNKVGDILTLFDKSDSYQIEDDTLPIKIDKEFLSLIKVLHDDYFLIFNYDGRLLFGVKPPVMDVKCGSQNPIYDLFRHLLAYNFAFFKMLEDSRMQLLSQGFDEKVEEICFTHFMETIFPTFAKSFNMKLHQLGLDDLINPSITQQSLTVKELKKYFNETIIALMRKLDEVSLAKAISVVDSLPDMKGYNSTNLKDYVVYNFKDKEQDNMSEIKEPTIDCFIDVFDSVRMPKFKENEFDFNKIGAVPFGNNDIMCNGSGGPYNAQWLNNGNVNNRHIQTNSFLSYLKGDIFTINYKLKVTVPIKTTQAGIAFDLSGILNDLEYKCVLNQDPNNKGLFTVYVRTENRVVITGINEDGKLIAEGHPDIRKVVDKYSTLDLEWDDKSVKFPSK